MIATGGCQKCMMPCVLKIVKRNCIASLLNEMRVHVCLRLCSHYELYRRRKTVEVVAGYIPFSFGLIRTGLSENCEKKVLILSK